MSEQLQLGGVSGELEPPPQRPDGLLYVDNFISESEEDQIVCRLDVDHDDQWLPDLSRRVQHYGFKYDYKASRIDPSMRLGELPAWLTELAARVGREGAFPSRPDQVIVNEYKPGQGISAHTDCEPCFGDTIATLSLGSDILMRFERGDASEHFDQRLKRRSLAVLSGDARYKWSHSIANRKSDVFDGVKVQRHRRISLTFRSVVIG